MKPSNHTSLEGEFWLSCESVAPLSNKCHALATVGNSQQRFSKNSRCLCFSIKSSNFPLLGIYKAVYLTKVSSCPAGSDPRLSINQSQVLELRELINKTFPSPGGWGDNEEGMAQANTNHNINPAFVPSVTDCWELFFVLIPGGIDGTLFSVCRERFMQEIKFPNVITKS